MPAGLMIPARNMPSMIGSNGNISGFGSSSGLTLGQVSVLNLSLLSNWNINFIYPILCFSRLI